MFSLRHLAAAQIPKNTYATQPIRSTCKLMYDEATREKIKLGKEREKSRACVDQSYEKYNAVLNPAWEDFMRNFVDEFEFMASTIVEQYDYLESLELALDHDQWYSYIEYIVCRAIDPIRILNSSTPRTFYPVIIGINTMINQVSEPGSQPSTDLAPIIQEIRRYTQLINKYLEQYDAKYSYTMCKKNQNLYGKILLEWQTIIKPTINIKTNFRD